MKKNVPTNKSFLLFFILLIMAKPFSFATEYNVTPSNVDSVLTIASPGDTIIFTDGTYSDQVITLSQSGTSSNPIVFKAQSVGGVMFNGSSSRIEIQGDYWIVDGFKWEDVLTTSSTAIIYFNGASNNVFKNNTVINSGRTTDGSKTGIMRLMNSSQNNIIEYNRFDSLVNMGIQVWAYGTDISNTGNIIRHNYFVNHDALEYIQLGQGGSSAFVNQYSIVELNLFENFDMEDPELISSKTSYNIIRHNTFRDCYSMVVLRTGQNSTIEGNWFFDSQGIRVHDKNHAIINNYIEGVPAGGYSGDDEGIVLYCGNMERPNTDGSHYPADSVLISNNTIINHTNQHLLVGKNSSSWSHQPDAVTIKNNLVTNNVGTAIINEASTNTSWSQNIAYPTGSGSTGNVANVLNIDPLLNLDGGIYKLQSTSPAIDSADSESLVTIDIEGQARNDLDIGADEYSSGSIIYSPLSPSDVGPRGENIIARFSLSTNVNGGIGSLSINPAGNEYDSAAIVAVTAIPGDGYKFDNWSGDISGTNNPLSVIMDSTISITANFLIDTTGVIAIPVDSVWATADDGNIPENVLDNNLSTRWSAEDSLQSITFQFDTIYQVEYIMIAWFSGNVRSSFFDIAVSDDGVSWNTIISDTSSGTTVYQEMVDIPDTDAKYLRYIGYGNSVNGWNSISEVDIFGSEYTNTEPVTPQYSLSTSIIGSGNLNINPSGGVYDSATVVTLTATADSGYIFDGWSGNVNGSNNPLSVTMSSNLNITATFVVSGGSGDTITIAANHDAHIRGGDYENDNFGSDTKLRLKESSANYTYRSLIQVDCSSEGLASCTSATLRLYIQYVQSSHSMVIYQTTDNWDESTITYSNAPSAGTAIDTISVNSTGWYEIDVTNYVSAQLASNDTVSFYFTGENTMNYSKSSETTSGPELVIITGTTKSAQVATNSSIYNKEPLLTQNYPNPFNAFTNISFENEKAGKVLLEIYSLNGTKINTLVNSYLPEGRYEFKWEVGRQKENNKIKSGVYIYRIVTPTYTQTNKMYFIQ